MPSKNPTEQAAVGILKSLDFKLYEAGEGRRSNEVYGSGSVRKFKSHNYMALTSEKNRIRIRLLRKTGWSGIKSDTDQIKLKALFCLPPFSKDEFDICFFFSNTIRASGQA